MNKSINREDAWALVRKYNKEPFHLLHALTMEGVMKWFAGELGFKDDSDYWGIIGLIHDIDFELYPEEHCKKAVGLLGQAGFPDEAIRSVCSHGYGIVSDIKPEHLMEKVLFAADELSGLIGAAARMRPSKSTGDMELSSLKKKFKDKKFAAGCSREVIDQGAQMLGWPIDDLLWKTLLAMRSCEADVNAQLEAIQA